MYNPSELSTVCKKKIFRDLIEYYPIHSYGKLKIVLEYRYASISWHV